MNEEMAPWVLVEGPAPGSAEFFGRWLLAAAKADRELDDQRARNPSLKQQISTLEVGYIVSFSPPATTFIGLLLKNLTCFPLDLWEEWGEMFSVMAELGFFSPTGHRYQMTLRLSPCIFGRPYHVRSFPARPSQVDEEAKLSTMT